MGNIFFRSNISKGTAFLLQGMFETDLVAKVVTIKTVTIGYLKKANELLKSNRDSVRKAREAYLIDRGQTLEPLGPNRRDET